MGVGMVSDQEHDFSELWADADRRSPRPQPREFCFREAGVERFNDIYDDGYDED